jgi:hypothetical protein
MALRWARGRLGVRRDWGRSGVVVGRGRKEVGGGGFLNLMLAKLDFFLILILFLRLMLYSPFLR